MISPLSIIKTSDGSVTLYNASLDEHYHSVHGAVQESRHVFIKNGLEHYAERHSGKIRILEVGFGTGLNALLAFVFSGDNKRAVDYSGLEPFPLEPDVYQQLNYNRSVGGEVNAVMNKMHINAGKGAVKLSEHFVFRVEQLKVQDFFSEEKFNVVFYDAFAWSAQPEMWSADVFMRLSEMMSEDGVLVTYAAKGEIKRNLKAAGFTVESLPGPPRKREMVRAGKR